MTEAETVVRRFVEAFGAGDFDALRGLLADDVAAYVTNADGGVDRVDGPDGYMARVPDVSSASYSVAVTQAVDVADGQVLAMVEIKAQIDERTLHNHAAFLVRVLDGQATEIWMVEALPAYSDEFWS
jgi:ketosteroid isomerase-like protein